MRKRVRRIVLARPAVEAGESLGFLPGDMQAKIEHAMKKAKKIEEKQMKADAEAIEADAKEAEA